MEERILGATPASILVTVLWKHERLVVQVSEEETVADVKMRLEQTTGIISAHQKLFHQSKKLQDEQTIQSIFFTAEAQPRKKRHSQHRHNTMVLVGSSSTDIDNAKKLIPEAASGLKSKIKRRRLVICGPRHNTASKYGFQSIEPLPGLPNVDVATALLHRLATDPGVVYVMKAHKWKVGCLTELYPGGGNGTFGAGTCLLGLNTNMGQKISLRIRTDNMLGFEKYLNIRETLFHELTHNVHKEHDAEFFAFMSQLQKEAREHDWTQSRGRKLDRHAKAIHYQHPEEALSGKGDFMNYGVQSTMVVEEATYEGDTQTLGVNPTQSLRDMATGRRDLAVLAAAVRLSLREAEAEEAKARTSEVTAATKMTDSNNTSASPRQPLSKHTPSCKCDAHTTAAAPTEAAAVTGTTPGALTVSAMTPPPRAAGTGTAPPQPPRTATAVGSTPAHGTATGSTPATTTGSTLAGPKGRHNSSTSVAAPSSASVAPAAAPVHAGQKVDPASLRQLANMGFVAGAREALLETGGDVSNALNLLLTQTSAPTASEEVLDTKHNAIAHAVAMLLKALPKDRARRNATLDTLRAVTRNALRDPSNSKFQTIRLSNKRFQRSVVSQTGALDVLLASGWIRSPDGLRLTLGRFDSALLWMCQSKLEKCQ